MSSATRLAACALAILAAVVACGDLRLRETVRQRSYPFDVRGVAAIPLHDSCPDPGALLAACTPLPLAINLHYFTTDACHPDSIGMTGRRMTAADARAAAERLVRNTNTFYREISDNPPVNNVEHGARDHATQCAPFRLVLAGVYVHCDSRYAAKLPYASKLRPLVVNADTELNYFLGSLTSSNGYASALGGTLGAQGGFEPNVLAHEVMHMLSINHVFAADGCDDTWGEIDWTWDKDGDGVADARGKRCWDWVPTPRGADGTLAEPDYCVAGNYHKPHPCCDTTNMNSNLMTYSNYASDWHRSTLSPCQVEKAVRHTVTQKCGYLYGVGGRLPEREAALTWVDRD